MRLNQLGLWVLLTCFCLLSPTHAAAGAQTSANCTRTVRVGTFDQAAPYSVAAITRWVDDGGTCDCRVRTRHQRKPTDDGYAVVAHERTSAPATGETAQSKWRNDKNILS